MIMGRIAIGWGSEVIVAAQIGFLTPYFQNDYLVFEK